jgi:hypothetical protein
MTYNGRNLFVLFYKMRAWLRVMSNSNHISQILLKKLFGAREEGNLSMEQIIFPKFLKRKMPFLQHDI